VALWHRSPTTFLCVKVVVGSSAGYGRNRNGSFRVFGGQKRSLSWDGACLQPTIADGSALSRANAVLIVRKPKPS
jgi:hypothetical protein